MKFDMLQQAVRYRKSHKRRKAWKNVVTFLAAIVVFITTYVLILPAITMEQEVFCGLEEHTHTEECCAPGTASLSCTPEIHSHTEDCYEAGGNVTCGYADFVLHSHNEFCYDRGGNLICSLQEITGHIHGEGCYETVTEPTEAPTEAPAEDPTQPVHTHTEECYTPRQGELLCLEEVTPGHSHSVESGCYTEATNLICTLEEGQAHTHGEGCYEVVSQLACQLPEAPAHVHEGDCYAWEQELTCGLEENTQEPTVAPAEPAEPPATEAPTGKKILVCGQLEAREHTHTEQCVTTQPELVEPVLTCALEEHTHGDQCFSDPGADVESAEVWERTLPQELSGLWAEDVLAVAHSQLGYTESSKNYVVDEKGVHRGYTRYGQWYGDHYGDWCAMFVSFCLDYAGVPEEVFPHESGCQRWVEKLAGEEFGLYYPSGEYEPLPGDVIFFDYEPFEEVGERSANHVGIVVDMQEVPAPVEAADTTEGETVEPATIWQLTVLEGNSNGAVRLNTYDLTDSTIMGYAQLPEKEPEVITLVHEGEDYTVEVSFTEEAGLPQDVILTVEEIPADSEEYQAYYQQMQENYSGQTGTLFCRFFDITFSSQGVEVEPEAPVNVNISYDEALPQVEGDTNVIHFTEDGTELIDAELNPTDQGGSAFVYTQDSFSVVGTIVSPMADSDTGYWIKVTAIDDTSADYLIVYENGTNKYALGANGTTALAASVELTELANMAGYYTCSTNLSTQYQWRFNKTTSNGSASTVTISNVSNTRYRVYPSYTSAIGNNTGTCTVTYNTAGYWTIYGRRYLNYNGSSFGVSSSAGTTARMTIYKYTASLPSATIWLDGNNGSNVMQLNGSENRAVTVTLGDWYTLPETWKTPAKYTYKLQGWYDIYGHKYYAPGEKVLITGNTVFYADWVAATYDVGQNNEHVVGKLDTSSFITTDVFDYGVLFNVQSAYAESNSLSASAHDETWYLKTSGTVPYQNGNTLGVTFRDWDTGGKSITYANGYGSLTSGGYAINDNQAAYITPGILDTSYDLSGKSLIDVLFGTNNAFDPVNKTGVIGKTYLGHGNYLYQYMDSSTKYYDGEHNGYYYYDSRIDAASYNQTDQRFYVYDYVERTSDSLKDGVPVGSRGAYSDFLPFNSPYVNTNGLNLVTYTDPSHGDITCYQYDAKYNSTEGGVNCVPTNVGINYGFGIASSINFYLPAASGETDGSGEYINQSVTGQDLTFEFSGDDDLWVFVDGELVMDIGGLHGIISGCINFSEGTVTTYWNTEMETVKNYSIDEGEHTLVVYYMERGGSQSNCAIYFNISPRYTLNITKTDYLSQERLAGAEFTIYTDLACTQEAELWPSEEAYLAGSPSQSTFACNENGVATCWGLTAGRVYYIKETKPPDDPRYAGVGGLIKVSLNARGDAEYSAVKLEGTPGFQVNGFDVDETEKVVEVGITNMPIVEDEHTSLTVQKAWADGNENHVGESIVVYLTRDGERLGTFAVLNAENNWTYTFDELPVSGEDGTYVYGVEEAYKEGYIDSVTETELIVVNNQVITTTTSWDQVTALQDGMTYILYSNSGALTKAEDELKLSLTGNLQSAQENANSQWIASANGSGFELTNVGTGSRMYLVNSNNAYIYQGHYRNGTVMYFEGNRLSAYYQNNTSNSRYYFSGINSSGYGSTNTNQNNGTRFTLYQKNVEVEQDPGESTQIQIPENGFGYIITNTPTEEDNKTDLTVNKQWADGNEDHEADTVTVHLYQNGKAIATCELKAENNWTYTFQNLPLHDGNPDNTYVYTVTEDKFGDYDASYSEVTFENGVYTVTVTNSIGYSLPETGGIGTTVYALGGAALMLTAMSLLYKKKRGKEETDPES